MKRSSKKTIPVHVTIPVRLLEDLDETLSYKQSRSRIISKLIENYLEGDQINIGSMTRKQILVALINQVESGSPEDVILRSLLQVFSE
jgi:metal-responsive CopG/Arc/MetJ family transcriptional regulator